MRIRRFPLAFLLGLLCVIGSTGARAAGAPLRVGIGPFPYDLTTEAVERVRKLVEANGSVYCVQLDSGVPWNAAATGGAFDAATMDTWKRHRDSIAPHHQVYLAIAPLAEDRTSWATAPAGDSAPAWARDETHLAPELQAAYLRYVLRAVEYFRPTYLNIGVEAGDLAAKLPSKWPLFERLFLATKAAVAKAHPGLKIGISSGLPLLAMPGVLPRARRVLDASDYVGISFYPYMSEFYARFGAALLPAPPGQWRDPLAWLAQNVRTPIAMCETAYSSQDVRLLRFNLVLHGTPELQQQYVSDLAAIAARDRYLFTVFFLTVDYGALMEKLRPGDETPRLWEFTGFFDRQLAEKPAWASYRTAWQNPSAPGAASSSGGASGSGPASRSGAAAASGAASGASGAPGSASASGSGAALAPGAAAASRVGSTRSPAGSRAPGAPGLRAGGTAAAALRPAPVHPVIELGFSSAADLFTAPAPDRVELVRRPPAAACMTWTYTYRAGQYAWAVRDVPAGRARDTTGLSFQLYTDRAGPLVVRVEEDTGETFYQVIDTAPGAWRPGTLAWSGFQVESASQKDGVLDPARLHRITLADGAASSGDSPGSRTVSLARFVLLPAGASAR